MLLGLCVILVTCLGWVVATTAARPADEHTRRRDLDRRSRQLRRHPERVNLLDVENLLLTDAVPATTVARVMRRAQTRQLGARTMWRWAEAHGTTRLVLVVDAALAEDTLLDHLDAGTAPDWRSLAVFADLANDTLPGGMPVAEIVDLDVVPRIADLTYPTGLSDWTTAREPRRSTVPGQLPPIHEPGLQEFSPIAAWENDGGNWPASA